MNILSLFDGISCGQVALNRAGIKYEKYYSSEIDKNAIKVTQFNYPETIQIGDVTKVTAENLPKIDILIGGSPCQGFSFAGKQLNFEDPRSRLFFEFVRLLKDLQPKYFLLENVVMKKEHQKVISDFLKVEPVMIDSKDFSAQSRKRLYWTNIPILNWERKILKSENIIGPDFLTAEEISKIDFFSMDFGGFKSKKSQKRIIKNFRGKDECLNCMTASNTANPAGNGCSNFVYIENGIPKWVKINRTQCELGQTLPVGYTSCISDTPAKKAIGNGWTVDVIAHIFKGVREAKIPLLNEFRSPLFY